MRRDRGTTVKAKFAGPAEMYEGYMPVIKIETEDGDDFYLSPFRAYKFQVSGTFEGGGDYGSSMVVGLSNCIVDYFAICNGEIGRQSNCSEQRISKEILRGQAALAIMDFCRIENVHFVDNLLNNDDFEEFITMCYNMVVNETWNRRSA